MLTIDTIGMIQTTRRHGYLTNYSRSANSDCLEEMFENTRTAQTHTTHNTLLHNTHCSSASLSYTHLLFSSPLLFIYIYVSCIILLILRLISYHCLALVLFLFLFLFLPSHLPSLLLAFCFGFHVSFFLNLILLLCSFLLVTSASLLLCTALFLLAYHNLKFCFCFCFLCLLWVHYICIFCHLLLGELDQSAYRDCVVEHCVLMVLLG